MLSELVPDQAEAKETEVSLPFPTSRWGRIWYGLFVTILPAFSFWATDLLKPEWQNGRLDSYIILLLFPEASMLFFPLLAYSIVSYLLLLFVPNRFSASFVVRAGIYTGVLLALHYSIVTLIYAIDARAYVIALLWIFPVVIARIYRWAVSKWTIARVQNVLLMLIVGSLLITTVLTRGYLAFLVLIGLLIAAPFWSFLLAQRAAIWLYRNYETVLTLPHGLGLTTWLAAYAAAWRYDILKMYELYAQLPLQPPDCYIATAAARGHPQFVRAHTVQIAEGRSLHVNRQLQLLKCAELALLAIHPNMHKSLRKIYDQIGKWLARKIQNRFLADIAYLLLKPGEWSAKLLLKVILPEIDSLSEKMYTK